MIACSFKGCGDPASVTVTRDGRAYCRGHGLAEASRRPACAITQIGPEAELAFPGSA